MKKIFKSVALMLALTLIIGLFPMNTQAASPKLSKSSVSLMTGESTTIKVKNYKKKVKWSSMNNSVATVSSSGKIKAVGEGYTYIIAKAGSKKLMCSVSVKFNSKIGLENLDITYKQIDKYTLAFIKNNNNATVSISGKMVSLDANGSMIKTSSDENYCVAPGAEIVMSFLNPYDSHLNYYKPADYKISWNVSSSFYKSYVDSIEYHADIASDKVVVSAANKSDVNLSFIKIGVIQYDASGNIIDYDTHYASCQNIGDIDYLSYYCDYDYNAHGYITPSSCDVIVLEAY